MITCFYDYCTLSIWIQRTMVDFLRDSDDEAGERISLGHKAVF